MNIAAQLPAFFYAWTGAPNRSVVVASTRAATGSARSVLREAGLIHTTKQGVEHRNVVREADLNARFPKLLKTIVGYAE